MSPCISTIGSVWHALLVLLNLPFALIDREVADVIRIRNGDRGEAAL